MATITVGPSGKDYTTIQAAVTAAANGDIIEVYAGTYAPGGSGAIVDGTGKTSITLRPAEAGVILDGGGTNLWGIIAKDNWTIGSDDFDLTIQNTLNDSFGAAIAGDQYFGASSGVTVKRVIFDTCGREGIVRLGGSGNLVDRCQFYDVAWAPVRLDAGNIHRSIAIRCGHTYNGIITTASGHIYQSGVSVAVATNATAFTSSDTKNCWAVALSGGSLTTGFSGTSKTACAAFGSIGTPGIASIVDSDPDAAGFTDTGTDDYTLTADSPLRGAGYDLSGTFTTDLAGNALSVPYPIGAYASSAVAAITGATLDSMTSITVAFDIEPVAADVEDTADWTVVSTTGGGAVTVSGVSVSGTDVTLTVSGLEHGHTYTVTGVNVPGSPNTAEVTTPVAVDTVTLDDLTHITVGFDGTPTAGDVENTTDWTVVSTSGGGAVSVTGVSVSGADVTLTVSGLARGHTYTVTSLNAGADPAAGSVSVPVAVASVVLDGPTTIIVTFEGTPAAADVEDLDDWTVTGPTGAAAVSVTGVAVAGAVVTLTISPLSSGYTYTVTAVHSGGDPDSDGVTYVAEAEATVTPPTPTERWIASEVQRMWNALLPGNRVDDMQREILLQVFEAWARLRVYSRAKIIGLQDLTDPFALPDEWLPHLGTNVLLTSDTGIPGHLSADQWRALIPAAGEMWRLKGIDLRPILIALQGHPVWIGDWHDLRHVLDVTDGLPLLGYDAADDGSNHDRTLTVHMADPIAAYPGYTPADGEAALNRNLIRLLIDAIRPGQQRVDVFFFDWLDDFSQGLGLWTSEAGRTPTWDSDAWTMTLDSATDSAEVIVQQVAGGVADHFEYATWEVWITLAEAVRTEIRLRHDGTDYFAVNLIPTVLGPTAGAVSLTHTVVGAIASNTASTVPLNERLFVRVTCTPTEGGNDTWTVDLDGDRVLTASVASQANTGPMQIRLAAGQTATVELVEQYQAPADTIRIGPEV